MPRRPLVAFLALFIVALGGGGVAFAHNSLDSSVPADGETVAARPAELRLVFAKDVPLETLTVTLTDPTGARSELSGSRHGATPEEVLTPLPEMPDGDYSVRWRLVGPDGHAITGRVQFTVAATAAPTTAATAAGDAGTTPSTVVTPSAEVSGDDTSWRTPGWIGWLLRYGSYLAMMTITGVVVMEAFVWRRAASVRFRRLVSWALGVVIVAAFLQLSILAADIAGTAPWSATGDLGVAAENPSGMALVIRIVLAVAAWLRIVHDRPNSPEIYRDLVVLLSLGLLATWSIAGHSRSMRWPWLGVPVDVVHHGAAAAWLGGLAIVGTHALRSTNAAVAGDAVRRFSTLAGWLVGLIVATGLVQAFRLGGSPGEAVGTTHGMLLVLKIALLCGMLWLADRNRRLVRQRLQSAVVTDHDLSTLRGAMRRELFLGLGILGVTASLVVLPPATADDARPVDRTVAT